MPEDVEKHDYESWAAGYRAAVCDLFPVPEKQASSDIHRSAVLFAYALGVMVAYVLFKSLNRE